MTEKIKIIFAVLITATFFSMLMLFQAKSYDDIFITYLQEQITKKSLCNSK